MKVSDLIVGYLIERGITDVFGYPGGMIAHFMDSLSKWENWRSLFDKWSGSDEFDNWDMQCIF